VLAFNSVEAIAIGFMISAWIDAAFTSLPVKKLLGYGILDQIRDLWKSAVSALLMALAVYAFGLLPLPLLPKLLLQILLGAAVYIAINLIIKNESFYYLLNTIKNKRRG